MPLTGVVDAVRLLNR